MLKLLVLLTFALLSSSTPRSPFNSFNTEKESSFKVSYGSVGDMSRAGGIGEEREADDSVQEIAQKVKEEFEKKVGRVFDKFTAIKYTTQVVAGTNYFIKICVGEDEYVHLRVFQSLQQELSVSAYQMNKSLDDPITYF